MLPEHLKGRTIHFCGPEDDYDEEEDGAEGLEDELDSQYDQMEVPQDPIDKRAELEKNDPNKNERLKNNNIKLTRHMKELVKFPPAYTGGAFVVMKDEKHALGMNDMQVTLFNLKTMQVLGTLKQENEEISTFALSPDQQYLATSNKSDLIRIFKMPEALSYENFSKIECFSTFKTTN